ncbi:MAG: hypothetical protein QGH73_16530 [Rhodospirillales bacterium]|jgi:hypothetical protein|nr:hypothetical protein [Rhodospirillaceae bacterium]MDP6429339.1 hypothetical protein [Rhodospirillales bacterium]MDP6644797.1 hypothetical protein [Rhodospirillales bacterium]MDP6843277.1 hypothetical protein [Rhodospirillales bacterium]|tara:strand:- start:4 stop:327 length:324 start_codon:yes stop_codon:yes gene_type:complete
MTGMIDDKRKTDRRELGERREDKPNSIAIERRQTQRRIMPERRQWHGLLFKTTTSLVKLEEWLDANAKGKWHIGIEDLDDKRQAKTIKIAFQLDSDKQSFVFQFGKK